MRTRNFAAVQRVVTDSRIQRKCRQVLDTQDQPPPGSLNTCLPYAVCGAAPCGSSPPLLNGLGGSFLSLNRETASCHSGCRNMGGSPSGDAAGRVREELPTHRPTRKENVSPLNDGVVCSLRSDGCNRTINSLGTNAVLKQGPLKPLTQVSPTGKYQPCHHHSEDCGFPFALFLFRLTASHFFLRGTCFCFVLSLVFPFSHFVLPGLVPESYLLAHSLGEQTL